MAVRTIDPITTEIIRSAFTAAADEMNATLIRSAYTPVIYEMKDCSVALLDDEHRVLGQSAGLPIFLGNLEICTRLAEETYGREAWREGDVWIMNDSYMTGTHLNDMTVFGPIFVDGDAVGVRGQPRPLARRRRQGPGRPDGLDRDLPGGDPPRAAQGGRGRRSASGHHRPARAQQPLLAPGGGRPRRADRVRPDRPAAARGDHRQVRDRDDPRGPGRDLRPDRAARARRRRRASRRRVPRRGCARQRRRRLRTRAGCA